MFLRSPEINRHEPMCPVYLNSYKKMVWARYWWFTPVILATWEVEIRRNTVQGQPRQIVHKIPSPK
jgi:hypothetical protein